MSSTGRSTVSADDPPPAPDPEPGSAPDPGHDPAGGELARSIARAYRDERRRSGGAAALPGRRRSRRQGQVELSGARADDRDPQRLDQLISRLVADHGWATDVAVHGVFARWDSVVGTDVAQHCRPEQFVDGRLVVRADSTAWATGMRLLAPTVLERLHEELGDDTVEKIEVRGPQAPSWRHGRFTVRDGRGPRDTYG
jgi:predicted nucleic acid-binding Zn ribbon protein